MITCPFCGGATQETAGIFHGVEEIPGWRCLVCNVKLVVTNPSDLPITTWVKHPTCRRRAIAHRKIVRNGSQTT